MKRIKLIFFSLFLSLFSGVVLADLKETDLLGNWYGERNEDGKTIKWLALRKSNNTFGVLFVVCSGANPVWVQKETGVWSYKNGVYQTITQQIEDQNGKKTPNTPSKTFVENYIDLSLAKDTLEYKHQEKGKTYKLLVEPR